jgi:Siphovirus ReqiPepy6 Gp37-like protein
VEIFILDSLLRRIDIIDEYESFIWTERYAEKGDCELVVLSTPANKKRFVGDTLLSINESKRIMRVLSSEETIDVEKGAVLKVVGEDLIAILQRRVIGFRNVGGDHDGMLMQVTSFANLDPITIPGMFVWYMCYPPAYFNPGDEIPFLQDVTAPSLYPESNIPAPGPVGGIHWDQKIDSLYNAVTDVAKAYDLGLRLYKDPNASKLYFEAYQGADRTTEQSMYPPVVFSTDMENLKNTKEYIDGKDHYNKIIAVYEYTEAETNRLLTIDVTVTAPELLLSPGGFDQKSKYVTITQLPDGMELVDVPAYLEQIANEELTRSRRADIFDGEIDQNSNYAYERDYYLGDIIEIRGNNGGGAFMRVVEQIFKYDSSGKAAYPSLINKDSILPGTWRSWKYDVNWKDMGSGEYWNNQ